MRQLLEAFSIAIANAQLNSTFAAAAAECDLLAVGRP
jgi:hypothetical protein